MTTKLDYFIQALKAECFRRRAWVFSVFSVTKEDDDKSEIYPFKIYKQEGKYCYKDPSNGMNLTVIEDSDTNLPLLNHKETIRVGYTVAANLPPIKEMFETTYGNMFFNYVALIYPFGNKIPFQFGRVKASKIEDIISTKLTSNPPNLEDERDPNLIYVDEYLKFGEAVMYLSGFTQLWVPGGGVRAMTCHPDTAKVKAALLEKYKGQLHDPAIIAKIEAELIKFDKENWINSDPDASGFLIKKKSTDIVRKKMFLMYGSEEGFEEKVDANPIFNSLDEGWDFDKFPDMLNVARVGSFKRGAETQLGGEAVKWLLRASSNLAITGDDCGTTNGIPIVITEKNKSNFMRRYIVGSDGPILLTEENMTQYINQRIVLRSPLFCKLDKTDYCAKCCGDKLSTHKSGLSMAVSDYGSIFMGIMMSAAHSKGLSTAKMDINTCLI